ncbi:MAG: flippase-like domain-containing protein [Rhodospirillaceae bacterium]|jgi:glycosyltransferase 2 family protein|nr:flippase-like domain-containing protein [Rhodospirillaceae bacterium]MBT5457661.1 flippase-like domain-containing protein [Rhodospirillaceae bacterium]
MTATQASAPSSDGPRESGTNDRGVAGPVLRWFGIVLTLIAASYFCLEIAEHTSALLSLSWQSADAGPLAASLGLYSMMLLTVPFGWYLLLRSAGIDVRWRDATTITLLSQFAKYVPGNVAHHIGRVALARAYGLEIPTVIATMTIETGWVVFTGTVIGMICVLISAPALLMEGNGLPEIWQLSVAGACGAVAPFLGAWLIGRWRPGPLSRWIGPTPLHLPGVPALVACFGVHTMLYLLMGGMLFLLTHQLFGVASADYWLLTGIFAVAWVAGFIVPGAPGGLGVREAILVAAMGPFYGGATAVAIAILLRLITTVGDGIGFLLGLFFRHLSKERSTA